MTEVEPAAGTGDPGGEQAGRHRRRRLTPLTLAVAATVIILDQLTKHWAVNALSDGNARHVIWTLQWNLTFNSGMAFSRGKGLGPVIAVVAFVVIITFVVATAHLTGRLGQIASGLLIGGAIGNLIDRLFRGDGWLQGSVVDFIDLQWFAIFNIADMGVTVGAILFALAAIIEPSRTGESS
jgi:signal peptidase II